MGITLKNIVKEKYFETDMDSLVFHFDDTKEEDFVKEFEVPEEMPYMVFVSTKADSEYPSWIEVVNPAAVLETDNAILPDIGLIGIDDTKVSFKELIEKAMK